MVAYLRPLFWYILRKNITVWWNSLPRKVFIERKRWATRTDTISKIWCKPRLQTWNHRREAFLCIIFMCFWTSWFWLGTRINLPKYYKKRCCWSRMGNTLGPMRPVLRRLLHWVCYHEKEHRATTFTPGACSAPGSIWGSSFQPFVTLGILWSSKCCSFFFVCFLERKQMAKTELVREVVESFILYPHYGMSCCY